ncbi:surfactin synthase thioesterase subunit [Kitasatospora sp. MAP12-15]|uniref:thioesterase II family protein n=1 Tax=unclassified Kitasatospora TaxID=2633591 RepID=UPI002474E0F1|nr:alpha/beta fold hydrolase [Kitasatospora sp. MAP12-44]MDH6114804.1 surfactin synthase thioesterase subunit [Kitasatospora sp. MAP12-44]
MFPHDHAAAPASTPWIRNPEPRPGARLRLICFHPAGGGPTMYRTWQASLPADVELLAVQLPGRETRIAEPHLTDYQEAVDQAYAAIQPFLDRPYVLFGHSMGAMISYGVALAARRAGRRTPARLVVSGCSAPDRFEPRHDRPQWSDARLVQELRTMGGTPPEVLAIPALVEMVLPTLRADYGICATFRRTEGEQLDCPVAVFGGTEDSMSKEDLELWAGVTTADSSLRMFPGGHFFLTVESGPEVLAALREELAAVGR